MLAFNPNRTDEAILYSSEGNVHVKRASSRVTAPPGGFTNNIFGGGTYEAESKRPAFQPPVKPAADIPRYESRQPLADARQPVSTPAPRPMEPVSAPADRPKQAALFCSEGSQLRNGPCRKIMHPPGGKTSISFM